MTRVTLRLDFDDGTQIGHGKVKLLELVNEHGSISAAGRAMGMSYRRAWLLVDALNRHFREPLVTAHPGGANGGGASLTPAGEKIVALYRAAEQKMRDAAAEEIGALQSESAAA